MSLTTTVVTQFPTQTGTPTFPTQSFGEKTNRSTLETTSHFNDAKTTGDPTSTFATSIPNKVNVPLTTTSTLEGSTLANSNTEHISDTIATSGGTSQKILISSSAVNIMTPTVGNDSNESIQPTSSVATREDIIESNITDWRDTNAFLELCSNNNKVLSAAVSWSRYSM